MKRILRIVGIIVAVLLVLVLVGVGYIFAENAGVDWSLDDFIIALRTGVHPNGTQINPDQMPVDFILV
ncbi:MAG: hypothetical protein Q9P01_04500 [Anaerolineae bacterium]|nr:hypothetical protein [Anaerolineae bacterium]